MYTDNKKISDITMVNGQNINDLLKADGKFFLQSNHSFSCDGANYQEMEDASRYIIQDHLDEGDMIIFVTREALENDSLDDVVFKDNTNSFYNLCDALQEAYDKGAMEQDDGQIIFGRTSEDDEIIVYDYKNVSGDLSDVASALFEDLHYGADEDRMEMISSILSRVQEKAGNRYQDFIDNLKNMAELKMGVLKEDLVPAY